MQCDGDDLVRQVAMQADDRVQDAEHHDGKYGEVPSMLAYKIRAVEAACRQERPVVPPEPELVPVDDIHDETDDLNCCERECGSPSRVDRHRARTRRRIEILVSHKLGTHCPRETATCGGISAG